MVAELAERELASWNGRVVALERMRELTLEIMLRIVFGARGVDELAQLRQVIDEGLAGVRSLPQVLGMVVIRRDLGPRSPWGRFRVAVERFDEVLCELVARRRSDPDGESLLSVLIEQRDEGGQPVSDQHIRDQLVALLVGGHDSTSASLSWAFERLARHPAVQDRLRDGDPAYLDAVVKEVLRVRPALTIAPRRLLEPARIGKRRSRPESRSPPACGWRCRREDLWPYASALWPERWLDGAAPNPLSWIPFGGGVRRCAGAPFAEMEMREVLRAAARLRIRPVRPEAERARRSMLVVVPDRGGEILVDP